MVTLCLIAAWNAAMYILLLMPFAVFGRLIAGGLGA